MADRPSVARVKMKLSDWLDRYEADAIYNTDGLDEMFRIETGYTPPVWSTRSLAAFRERDMTDLSETKLWSMAPAIPGDLRVTTGYEIAQAIGQEFLRNQYEHCIRRKRLLYNVVQALRAAGL